jgi:hypothetical protein
MNKIKITKQMEQKYIQLYKDIYSVSAVMKIVNDAVGRNRIVNILKKEGIYEGLNGENYLKMKVLNNEKIMMERYGVKNWGQTPDGGWKPQNKIPYKKITYLNESFSKYHKLVEKKTKKYVDKIKEKPSYCEYTGIQFADVSGKTNPNDPRKRSVDHKIPIVICYLNNVSVEDAADTNNIRFVLRYVNSIKQNTLHESFLPIAIKIREVFINEGYESTKINYQI